MKRCPACDREHDDALKFCPKDGTLLVSGGGAGQDSGTLRFGSAPVTGETETRAMPTREAAGRPAAPTTVLDAPPASGGTQVLGMPKSRRGFLIAASAIIVVTVAASAYYYLSRVKTGTAKNSIAVLPFQNAGGDPNMDYLSDGISESLINSLSQLPNLAVKARSTMFRYKGLQADPQKVGSDLNVQAVLSGRVVQRGEDLTLSLELVDPKTGDQMWGEQYNRKLADLVALQNEIARDVSNKLRLKLSGADEAKLAKNYTANPEAYQLYLRGRYFWNKRTEKDILKAVEYFQQAVAIDPSYALAFTGLADAYSILPQFSTSAPGETMPKAQEFALTALTIDNNLAEAHAALGNILATYNYDVAGAEREYKMAVGLNPNYATAHQWYGELLNYLGRHEESFVEFRLALGHEPYSLVINRVYGDALFRARKYDESIAQLKRAIELDGDFAVAYRSLSSTYHARGNHAESVEAIARYFELSGNLQAAASARESFAAGGWQQFLRTMSAERHPPDLPANIVAGFLGELGEKDRAFTELDRAYNNRQWYLLLLKVDPRLDPLRSDPRFADLVRRVGLPQ